MGTLLGAIVIAVLAVVLHVGALLIMLSDPILFKKPITKRAISWGILGAGMVAGRAARPVPICTGFAVVKVELMIIVASPRLEREGWTS